MRWDLLPRNAAEDAQPPRVSRKKHKIWTPQQLAQFVRHVQNDRFFAPWLLVVTTGIRRGDLAGLLKEDLDLDLELGRGLAEHTSGGGREKSPGV